MLIISPHRDDRTTGTFAVGSTEGLGLLSSFGSLPEGDDTWSLTFSATVTTIPEPPTWLMLMAGGAGLLVDPRSSAPPGVVARRVPA